MCGTPVIAYNRGSMPELILDGISGYLVNNIQEAIDAVHHLDKIDRAECRKHALSNFTGGVMAAKYLSLYKEILDYKKLVPVSLY